MLNCPYEKFIGRGVVVLCFFPGTICSQSWPGEEAQDYGCGQGWTWKAAYSAPRLPHEYGVLSGKTWVDFNCCVPTNCLLCSNNLSWTGLSEASNTVWLVGTRKLAVISAISRESGAGANIRKNKVVKINVSLNIMSSWLLANSLLGFVYYH